MPQQGCDSVCSLIASFVETPPLISAYLAFSASSSLLSQVLRQDASVGRCAPAPTSLLQRLRSPWLPGIQRSSFLSSSPSRKRPTRCRCACSCARKFSNRYTVEKPSSSKSAATLIVLLPVVICKHQGGRHMLELGGHFFHYIRVAEAAVCLGRLQWRTSHWPNQRSLKMESISHAMSFSPSIGQFLGEVLKLLTGACPPGTSL